MPLKILCAGMNSTGTSSLYHALIQLGYRAAKFSPTLFNFYCPPDDWDIFGEIEAILDIPYYFHWREIYQQYHCKVILTVRDPNTWFDSLVTHIQDNDTGNEQSNFILFGHGYPHRKRWTRRFQEHNEAVMREIPSKDLLVLDVTANHEWEPLCEFLGKPIPDDAFPHIP